MVALTPMGGQVVEEQSARSIMMETRSSMTRLTTGDGVWRRRRLEARGRRLHFSAAHTCPSSKVAVSGAPSRF